MADRDEIGWERPPTGEVVSPLGPTSPSSVTTYGSGYAEVLPPGPPSVSPQAPRVRRQRSWADAPATYILVGINCAVFLAMTLSGVSLVAPSPEQLIHWGADYGPFVLVFGQWWRLITAMFVHIGLLHLGLNMWCLWNLGLLGEPLLGVAGTIAAYILTGFAGNVLSLAINPGLARDGSGGVVGAGASGAIFGLAGVLIVLLSSKYLPLPPADRQALRKNVIWFAVLNFVLGFGSDLSHFSMRIDNMAHLGGFVAGLLLALPMVPRIGAPRALFTSRRNLAIVGEALLLLLLCAGIRAFYLGDVQGS